MWVLIMTIVFAGNSGYAGVAGATVATQEFNNSATCRLAGAEWAKAQPSVKNNLSNGGSINWVCVQK
jgi:hypothetical protein